MIDLNHYCWRERTRDEDGNERFLVPHADPDVYESPIDLIFATSSDALVWLGEAIEEEWVDREETRNWALVHYRGAVVI